MTVAVSGYRTFYLCVADEDDCVDVECYNGGTCIDGVSQFSCMCETGYTGNLCQSGVYIYLSSLNNSIQISSSCY